MVDIESNIINKKSGAVLAVHDVRVLESSIPLSFELFGGEIICLFGMNGSGKTLLLKALCGIFKPFSGNISLDIDIKKRGICLQFPEHLVFNEDSLSEALLVTGSKESAVKLLNEIGVTETQPPLFMSDGQKRLLFLFGYLESRELLIFDEPFASLDKDTKNEVSDKIKQARDSMKSIIYTANRLSDTAIADKVIEIKRNG